jgi:hypothetical protein
MTTLDPCPQKKQLNDVSWIKTLIECFSKWMPFPIALVMNLVVLTAGHSEVVIKVYNHSGVSLHGIPARGGVPFACGVLREGNQARLLTGAGMDLPCRVRPIAHWYDGSVKWLLVDTQVDLPPAGELRLRLVPGEAGSALKGRVKVQDTAYAIMVDTGPARFQFSKKRFGLPGAAWADLGGNVKAERQVMAQPGEIVCEIEHQPPGPPTEENWLRDAAGGLRETFTTGPAGEYKAEVESANDLRAVIKLTGWLVNDQGRKLIQYVIRVHACAGRPELEICPTFIYAGKPKEDFIRSLYLRFPRTAEGVAEWALGGESKHAGQLNDEAVSLVSVGPEKFYHLVPYTKDKTVYYSVVQGGKPIATGKEAAGWIRIGDQRGALQAAVRNFWQMHPKELRAQRDGLTVFLWPEQGGKILDLRRRYDEIENVHHYDLSHWEYGGEGVGVTHEMLLRFGPAGEDVAAEMAARLNAPLLLECAPQYYADTLAFGPFAVADAKRFPRLEGLQTVGVEWMRHNQRVFHWDGMIDYGDTLFHGYETPTHYGYKAPKSWGSRGYVGWLNSESVMVQSLFLQYLRTGDYALFLTAAEMARHSMDVDVCHHCAAEPRQIGGGHRHDQQHWGNGVRGYGADTQGIMDFYLLTGNERALDVARERAMYHDNGIPSEDEDRIGGLYRFWEITGEDHWRLRAAELLAEELKVPPEATWLFATLGHFRFISGASVSLQYYYWAASPGETAPLREAVLRTMDSLKTWEPTYLPLILCSLAYQISGDAKYAQLLAGLLARLNLPPKFELPADYRAVLRRLPFEEMVVAARHWSINEIYTVLIHNICPLPYVIAALQKIGLDEQTAFADKFSSPPPPPFEELLDPKKITGGIIKMNQAPIYYGYYMKKGAPGDLVGRSQLMLLEDGKPLEPHQGHELIRKEGRGRFDHWGAHELIFSSSDNTDPRTNGRQYKAVYPWPKP